MRPRPVAALVLVVASGVGPPLGPFPAGTPVARRIADLVERGRVLRLDVERSTGGNVGAVEIGVYAPRPGDG